ncbi:alpha/beta hydrolase [Halobacillus locisalis]|uniref:Alpha/beta hydrolase n=1 Tax=Halobacillus locisalis TaxID=220753 RepID=A0A838CRT8_9BACI|nr:alpha/beta family hydrolase [Halobacillus locisalis]MBA2174740.1 alpha/beta hydrolase [Halobacillus locisalis]
MRRFIKYASISLGVLLLVGVLGFYIWSQQTYEASGNLEEWVVQVDQTDFGVVYEPNGEPEGGVVLYPGAKVEPEAYSYIAEKLSENGFVTGVPDVRLNLALLDTNKAQELMDQYPSVEKWYIGGHSLGGVAAASFVSQHETDGLILLAAYPTEGNSFENTDFPILSIYAENDGLTTLGKVEETEEYLSDQTTMYKIEGGNHAQFGVYGEQKGDMAADISVMEQQDEIVQVILEWLRQSDDS